MQVKALEIIQDAYERLNRLSPGETLSADDSAFGFRRLNLYIDELAGQQLFLFQDVLTAATQSGPITLGVGAWAAISPGDEVISAKADNMPMDPITMQQYNSLYQPQSVGRPQVWARDGLNTVYLWPVPAGNTIQLQTRTGVAAFADLNTTSYTVPDGYKALLGAGLAVRCAIPLLGAIPRDALAAEKRCMDALDWYDPAKVDVYGFSGPRGYYPPRLFS